MNFNIPEIWPKLLLFLVDGIAGYGLQFFGYAMSVFIFNNRKFSVKIISLMTVIFSLFAFLIRKLHISFGFHTILIMISCILLSYIIFNFSLYPTVFSVLFTAISVLFFEMVTVLILTAILGQEQFDIYFKNISTIQDKIVKSLMGLPQNILLILEMYLLYKIQPKFVKKVQNNGKVSSKNC